MSHDIIIDNFLATDIRLGTLAKANTFPEAHKPGYKLTTCPGPKIGINHSSAQITTPNTTENLTGQHITCVVSLPTCKIHPFSSETLTADFPR